MDVKEKARMEEFGYVVTTASEWLGLTQAESHEIEIGIALTFFLCSVRERSGLSVARAARKLKTTPARLSRLERGEPGASLDLLITSALGLGATFREVGETIASWPGEPGVDDEPASVVADRVEPAASAQPPKRAVRRTRSTKAA
ncbi:MAG TPA: helix-turn-helix transcriptional regulator [Longimicrobium sp.]|jgi:transcriptional regulator with XRE-family HTH domain|nr:helix-turn-helix transcriptional regulator [Longimicrobium sp.]